MRPTITDLLEHNNDELPFYAWPGGYPIVYIDGYDCLVCPKCANELMADEYGQVPKDWFIHYEGDSIFCGECNTEIESVYGNPEDD